MQIYSNKLSYCELENFHEKISKQHLFIIITFVFNFIKKKKKKKNFCVKETVEMTYLYFYFCVNETVNLTLNNNKITKGYQQTNQEK